MSYLVKNGTDVNQTDHRGMTALDTAAMRGNAAVAAELLLIPGVFIEVATCQVFEMLNLNHAFAPHLMFVQGDSAGLGPWLG